MKEVIAISGIPGDTFRMASTNTAQRLTTASIRTASGRRAIAVLLTCETNNVRFIIDENTTPTVGASGLGHILYAGQSLMLSNPYAVAWFTFISALTDTHGAIQITPLYENLG